MRADDEQTEHQDQRLLLRVCWGGVLFAAIGEMGLMLWMRPEASDNVVTFSHFIVAGTISLLMLLGIAGVFGRKVGGGGVATAMICWMTAKAIAVLGIVAIFLGGEVYGWIFFGIFAMVMGWLHPARFT